MTSANTRIAVTSGDLAADGPAIVSRLAAEGAFVVVGTSDLETADEIIIDVAAATRDTRVAFTFVDDYRKQSLDRLRLAVEKFPGDVETWIHVIDARDAVRFAADDFSFCSTAYSEVNAIAIALADYSIRNQTSRRLVVQLRIDNDESTASQVLCDGLAALLRSHATTHCRTNLVVAAGNGSSNALASTLCFLSSPDSHNLRNGRFDIASANHDADQFNNEQSGDEVLKRVAAAGFTIRDAATRYWQQQYSPPSPQLKAVLDTPSEPEPGRVILIVGASRGIGLEASREFARRGHRVIGCARSAEATSSLAAELGPGHDIRSVDITDDVAVGAWAADVIGQVGTPDLVLNNAAITNSLKQAWRIDASEFENVLRINVLGTANVIRHFVPRMIAARRGVIVNFSSAMGRMTSEKSAPYCASKWAIEGLTGALSKEVPRSLAAVTLHPGNIQTDAMAASFGESATLYPTAAQWAQVAVPYLLQLGPADNGRQLSVPGMTAFRGIGPRRRGTSFTFSDLRNDHPNSSPQS